MGRHLPTRPVREIILSAKEAWKLQNLGWLELGVLGMSLGSVD